MSFKKHIYQGYVQLNEFNNIYLPPPIQTTTQVSSRNNFGNKVTKPVSPQPKRSKSPPQKRQQNTIIYFHA